jgi:hypothetical protein
MTVCGQSNGENQQVNALMFTYNSGYELNFNFELKKTWKDNLLGFFFKTQCHVT